MSGCSQPTITDAAFVHLKGIHTLNMSECSQLTITDSAFVHLKSIHTLDMSGCYQLTGKNFILLNSLKILFIRGCNELTRKRAQNIFGVSERYADRNVKFFRPDSANDINIINTNTTPMGIDDFDDIF
jgi:hypothetical protein